jgi:ferrous iron transport protein B
VKPQKTIALAGQPNSGKSTLFNSLTGARQHVANYPGITVEKKTGQYIYKQEDIEIIDLPGTYSLTSYSPEERVTRDYILSEQPETVVNIIDAVSLERHLLLTFQLIEMGCPIVMCVNKKDVAEKRGIMINPGKLEAALGLPVIYGSARQHLHLGALKESINESCRIGKVTNYQVTYDDKTESAITEIEEFLESHNFNENSTYPYRWLAIKLLENDSDVRTSIVQALSAEEAAQLFNRVEELSVLYSEKQGYGFEIGITLGRNTAATTIVEQCMIETSTGKPTISDRIDAVVLHRIAGPLILLGVLYCFYWITMVGGQKITDIVFPYFQIFRNFVSAAVPAETLLRDGLLRALLLGGIVDGVVMILNYLPIFYALYLAIAVLEDTGYMARIAFIMDRVLRFFGLHGQSTLPMLLGGALVGGCAVPGVMATRTIKEEKARLVTILVIPLLNCMAKVPFYVLMTSIFFPTKQAIILWIFSVSTFIVALLIAKLLSSTIVKGKPDPFVLELPGYHVPSIRNVFTRGTERLWLFIKKVATIVVAVSVLIWAGVSFPSPGKDRQAFYETQFKSMTAEFLDSIPPAYARFFTTPDALVQLEQLDSDFSLAKRRITSDSALQNLKGRLIMKNPEFTKILLKGRISLAEEDIGPFRLYLSSFNRDYTALQAGTLGVTPEEFYSRYMRANPYFFAIVRNGGVSLSKGNVNDPWAKTVAKQWKDYASGVAGLRRDLKTETLHGSILGGIGKFLEPVSSVAGMDWKVNIAVLGSFAAKEALVSTLGTIYSMESADGQSLKSGIQESGGFRGIHALAIMIFIAFFPPCLATIIMIRTETGSVKWMMFSIIYPIILGFIVAVVFFQTGILLGF